MSRIYAPTMARARKHILESTEESREKEAQREADERRKGQAYVEKRVSQRQTKGWEPMQESWMIEVERETARDEARGVFRHHRAPVVAAVPMTPEAFAAIKDAVGQRAA